VQRQFVAVRHLEFTAGTFSVTGCINPANDKDQRPLSDQELSSSSTDLVAAYSVTGHALTLTFMNSMQTCTMNSMQTCTMNSMRTYTRQ
jgi:hypothetical protein